MTTPPAQPGYQPTLKDKVSQSISRNAPMVVGKLIRNLMYALFKLWGFIVEMFHDTVGR